MSRSRPWHRRAPSPGRQQFAPFAERAAKVATVLRRAARHQHRQPRRFRSPGRGRGRRPTIEPQFEPVGTRHRRVARLCCTTCSGDSAKYAGDDLRHGRALLVAGARLDTRIRPGWGPRQRVLHRVGGRLRQTAGHGKGQRRLHQRHVGGTDRGHGRLERPQMGHDRASVPHAAPAPTTPPAAPARHNCAARCPSRHRQGARHPPGQAHRHPRTRRRPGYAAP
jgi:hypothetical protein